MSNKKQNLYDNLEIVGTEMGISLSKGEVVNNISDDWIPFRRQK